MPPKHACLSHGDFVTLGDMQLVMVHHPRAYQRFLQLLFVVKDSNRSYRVFIANMPSIIKDKRFQDVTDYPSIRQDYAHTFKSMKKMRLISGSLPTPAILICKGSIRPAAKKDGKGYPGKQSQITSISTYNFSPSAPRHSKRPNDSNNNRDRYSNHNGQHNVVELGF